ncbi:MAG TPA: nuclear transport factor 2 family protein [Humisphaera sp.]
MREPTPTLAAEIDAVRAAYAALNRGDVPGFVRLFDADVERVEELPGGTSCRGLAAVTRHVAEARATWAEGGCEPRRFRVAGNRVVAFVDVRVRLKAETQWREGRTVDVYAFRDGKVVEFRTFLDERRAVDWAGVQDPDATGDPAGRTGAAGPGGAAGRTDR